MMITYRRKGGLLALVVFAAVVVAAMAVTIALLATILIVAVAVVAAVVLVRAVLPRSWRHRTVAPATPWPHDTIEGTVVNPTSSVHERRPVHIDSHTGNDR